MFFKTYGSVIKMTKSFSNLNDYYSFLDIHFKADLTIFFMNLLSDPKFHERYKDTTSYKTLFNTPYDQPPEDHPCHGEDQGIRKPDEFYCVSYSFHAYLKEKNYLTACIMGSYIWGFEKQITNRAPENIVDDFYNYKMPPNLRVRKPLWDG